MSDKKLIEQPVTNRWTGKVMFTAPIEADEATPLGVRLGLAARWALKNNIDLFGADLTGADLRRADLEGAILTGAGLTGADLRRACLEGANLTEATLLGANLRGAVLGGARLDGARLEGADLEGANLDGANLRGDRLRRIIARVQRETEPYTFVGFELEAGGVKVLAGCRWLTLPQYRQHVADAYPDTPKARETLAILDFIEARATALGVGQPDANPQETDHAE